jgi:chromate reductase, NAD(P)H dehydrogenase (quinone)
VRDKPFAVIGASPSPGGAGRAQSETRTILTRIGARIVGDGLRIARAYQQFDPDGRMVDPDVRLALQQQLHELVAATTTPTAGRSRVARAREQHLEVV